MRAAALSKSSAASVTDDAGIVYADTSAVVKLVVREAETDAMTEAATEWERIATSEIATIELPRAVKRARTDGRAEVADDRTVLELLAALEIVSLTDDVRAVAASAEPPELRTLDAIHLASAVTLGASMRAVATYDDRLERAARSAGLRTIRPD
jgi:predicted nucleic acid-binding protein